jgi:hypothetical protein
MAAKSDNKYDVYEWIKQVIDSCQTYFHYSRAHNLIDNFFSMYQDSDLSGSLRNYAHDKQFR